MMRLATRIAALLLAITPLACSAAESGSKYELGEHYFPVRNVSAPSDPAKIRVTEVFWYGCPHCYKFDPYVERWLDRKAGDVEFSRMPSSLGRPQGLMHSRAFYTAESLGVFEQFHPMFFKMMQEQRMPMDNPAAIGAVFERLGISTPEFDNTFNGFAVDNRVRKAEGQIRDYGITSVPSVVIGGRYWTNATVAGGSYDKLLDVVDEVVAKIRAERKGS